MMLLLIAAGGTEALGLTSSIPLLANGYISVTLEPTNALQLGAQWALGADLPEAAWHNSGETVPVFIGYNTIRFKSVSNWWSKTYTSVNVASASVVCVTNTYLYHPSGTLTVNMMPTNLLEGNLQWRFAGESTWRGNGSVASNVIPGEYWIALSDLSGYAITPATRTAKVGLGADTVMNYYYIDGPAVQITNLTCHLEPDLSPIHEAQWSIRRYVYAPKYSSYSYRWHSNGAAASSFPTNDFALTFQRRPFWRAPEVISSSEIPCTNGIVDLRVAYTPNYMTNYGVLMEGRIEPEAARKDMPPPMGYPGYNSMENGGYNFTYKTPGVYTMTFASIVGWIAPPTQIVDVAAGQVAAYTGVYAAADAGTRLTVNIEPSHLRDSVRWYIQGQPWSYRYESGRTLTHLAPGDYTIKFGWVFNYDVPDDITVTVTTNAPVEVVGEYAESGFCIQAHLSANDGRWAPEGARWAIAGENSTGLVWRLSDERAICMQGNTVVFSRVEGWFTPPEVVVTDRPAYYQLDVEGVYTCRPDAKAGLKGDLYPSCAVSHGAQWGIRSGSNVSWHASGASVTNLTPGAYDITFSGVDEPGWYKPGDRTISIRGNEICAFEGAYTADPVRITCSILPTNAVSSGAKWTIRYNQGLWLWRASGETFTGQPGHYEVIYKPINGWSHPAEQSCYLPPGAGMSVTGQYERLKDDGVLQVWLSPSNPVLPQAGWRLDAATNVYGHGAVLTNLSVGAHTISFCYAHGYFTPDSIEFLVGPGEKHTFSGAYMRCHYLNIRVFLEGPLLTTNLMRMLSSNMISRCSPYAADPRTVENCPRDAVDWVLIQLTAGTNLTPYFSRSAFLRNDGWVMNDFGLPGIPTEFKSATNWLVIQHRNHLAVMSAEPLDANACDHTNNFLRSETSYRGGSNAAIQASGIWCMAAGDTDGDGRITALDYSMMSTLRPAGLCRADMNLTESVNEYDDYYVFKNRGRHSQASCAPETILNNQLVFYAEQQTVLSLSTTRVEAAGAAHLDFVVNSSGAAGRPATNGFVYVAGAGVGQDSLQAWNENDQLGRIHFNVISPEMATSAGKAIVLAGTSGPNDPNAAATHYLAEKAYSTLRNRGFPSDQIQYLSFRSSSFTDGALTRATAADALSNWARASEKLVVYFVDHGSLSASSEPSFRLNAAENLAAHELDQWLDALQDAYGTEVVVVIDCCRGGAFQEYLQYDGSAERVVIASSSADEPAYFVAGGQISFSDAFFSGVLLGYDVGRAFSMATNAMSAYQHGAMMPAEAAQELELGFGALQENIGPHIGEVCPNRTLTDRSSATLWVRSIVSPVPLKRVWCAIIPPNHQPGVSNPVSQMAQAELLLNDQGEYEAVYGGFSQQGSYRVLFYAEDVNGRVSLPLDTHVVQAGFDERAILVISGKTNEASSLISQTLASMVYRTLCARSIPQTNISLLYPDMAFDADLDGDRDVFGIPSCSNLQAALDSSFSSAKKLTLYLTGSVTNGEFCLNGSETLSSDTLDYLLDRYQRSNRLVITVLDFDRSGAYVTNMAPPDGRQRINIASASATGASLCQAYGLVSFSQFFFSHILVGRTLGEAFVQTRFAMFNAAGHLLQTAWLNDNGNGAANEKNLDGVLASGSCIGTAFLTGTDLPEIHRVCEPAIATNDAVLIWASDVTASLGVSNVWCMIAPPNVQEGREWPFMDLAWNAAAGRYEGVCDRPTHAGLHILTFLAKDQAGQFSLPMQSLLYVADPFEPDSVAIQALDLMAGEAQTHNFHAQSDEDWIRFFAVSGIVFSVEARQMETNVDVRLEVFYEKADGALTQLAFLTRDEYGKGAGLVEAANVDFTAFPELKPGMYYVRVSSAAADGWGWDSGYRLQVSMPAETGVVVSAVDLLNLTAVSAAEIWVDGEYRSELDGVPYVSLNLEEGLHTIELRATGQFMALEDPHAEGQVANPWSSYGNPRWVQASSSQARFAAFPFMPYVALTGCVRDKWTGAPLEAVRLSFVARDGLIAGLHYDGHPAFALYKQPWQTGSLGQFPEVVLPAVNWDLTLSRAHYCTGSVTNMIPGYIVGTTNRVGDLFLVPDDRDSNGIADEWQVHCFGSNHSVQPEADDDHDGQSNQEEYWLDTDPTNARSFFAFKIPEAAEPPETGVTLTWPTAPGRLYAVQACGQLEADSWTHLAGPWTADVQSTSMTWTQQPSEAAGSLYYRVRVVCPTR